MIREKIKICYLLESADLGGGVRVVFDQARALTALGHEVVIRACFGDHSWYPYSVNIRYVEKPDTPFEIPPDALICTYWTTVKPAINLKIPLTFHLCQGYEGSFPELKSVHSEIEAAYRIPIPKLAIGEWISERLVRTFGADAFPIFTIGQIVDTELFRPESHWLTKLFSSTSQANILVVGDYPISCKGIADALKAVAILRSRGIKLRLIRVSLYPLCDEEQAITPVDESYVRILPTQMASIYRNSDILIAPYLSNEGFGLPLAEAMTSGIPAIATRIPSFLSFDEKKDYAVFVPTKNPEAIADGIRSIMRNPLLKMKLASRGPSLIRKKFNAEVVASRITNILTKCII